jgi:Skp family chaperone for outer membrane proteins
MALVSLVPAEAKPKIAIFNSQRAILSTEDGKAAATELKRKFEPDQEKLDQEQREIDSLGNDLRASNDIEEMAALRARIDALVRTHYRRRDDLHKKLEEERIRVLNQLGQKMMAVVEKIAKQKHFEVVLDASDPNTPVYWRAEKIDITDEVIKRYDSRR